MNLSQSGDTAKGEGDEIETGVVDEGGEDQECLICLSEEKNTIIMPCGHLCVCTDCGKRLQADKKFSCPICRGPIVSLIPFNRKKKQ